MSEKIKSERTYFSFRYAIPGYTFIAIILLINIEFFISYMRQTSDSITFFGIILGFFTLLSGSAIGFVVSQIWYVFNNYILKDQRIIRDREPYMILNELFENFEDINEMHATMIYFLTTRTMKRIDDYISRLNDMFHTLGSTFFTIVLGLILGYLLRLRTTYISIPKNYDCLIIGFSTFFLLIIYLNTKTLWKEHDDIATRILNIKGENFRIEMQRSRTIAID